MILNWEFIDDESYRAYVNHFTQDLAVYGVVTQHVKEVSLERMIIALGDTEYVLKFKLGVET